MNGLRPHVRVQMAKVVLHVPVLGHGGILGNSLLNKSCSGGAKIYICTLMHVSSK
jgi:hypothetical protein